VRGVSVSSNIIRTLLEREWVRVVGHRDVPGRPAMYATTKAFLDYFNLKTLDDLPALTEIRDLDKINAELDLDGQGDPLEKPPNAMEELEQETVSQTNIDEQFEDEGDTLSSNANSQPLH